MKKLFQDRRKGASGGGQGTRGKGCRWLPKGRKRKKSSRGGRSGVKETAGSGQVVERWGSNSE